jgi:two-component system, OmpR family, sensor histidine kinase SenX3
VSPISKAHDCPVPDLDFAGGNTGLGLYFARQVAAMHREGEQHGEVRLQNGGTYGGACFAVRLP